MVEIKGQCLCGQVKVTLKEPPLRNIFCFCSDCALTSSSPGSAVILAKARSTDIVGDMVSYSTNKTKSGNTKKMNFCSNCYTGINGDPGPGLVIIRAGIFSSSDQVNLLVPKKAVYTDQKTDLTTGIGQFIHSKL